MSDDFDPANPPEIPDRVSLEPLSPFYWPHYVRLGVRINGKQSNQVVEFCQSEGWARLCQRNGHGRMKRNGQGVPLTITVSGEIKPFWLSAPIPDVAVVSPTVAEAPPREKPEISREQARRLRQAAAKEAKAAARRA